jgi:F-type H+-transporting ATPase subunit a
MSAAHPPDPMHHVQDARSIHLFDELFGGLDIPLPGPIHILGYDFHFTKFMLLEVMAAVLIIAIYVPLANRIRGGGLPTGPWWNFFEVFFVFIRDKIARPYLDDPHAGDHGHGHGHAEHAHAAPDQHHDKGAAHVPMYGQELAQHPQAERPSEHAADRFVPFLATMFLFILFCNLLGMIPFLGSPTSSIWVTGALAVCSFIMFHAPGIAQKGLVGYFAAQWPHIDVPYVGWFFSTGLFAIEMLGTVIKSGVLAIRLFANLFAGHMVLATILMFIYTVGTAANVSYALWGGVSVASVVGVVALSLLELFVAFLQAYVFTFLTSLFMGMSLYPAH